MSPHELSQYRKRFDAACRALGWSRHTVEWQHEREWNCRGEKEVWFSGDNKKLFDEEDLTPGMMREIIRLAELIGKTAKT